jgi:hypothetical protein
MCVPGVVRKPDLKLLVQGRLFAARARFGGFDQSFVRVYRK